MTPEDTYADTAELYDHVVPYRERPDIAFWVAAAVDSGGPVLEVGCGTGRVLLPTVRAGVPVVGLDLSLPMLAVCRQRLAAEPDEVRTRADLVQADMRDFDLGRTFPLVTTPFRSFQHLLTVADQLAALGSIRRHLQEGGRLILDLFNPWLERLVADDLGRETGSEPEFEMPDGRRVLRRERTVSRDLANQVVQVDLVYHLTWPDGRSEELVHRAVLRYLFRYEAEHLLARAGFEVETVWGDYERRRFGTATPGELILLARRRRAPPKPVPDRVGGGADS